LGAEAPPPISDPAPPTLLKNDFARRRRGGGGGGAGDALSSKQSIKKDKQCTAREDLFVVAKDAEKEIKDINLQDKGATKQIQN
jgi:hypothetical protein